LLDKDAVLDVVRAQTKKVAQLDVNIQAVEAGFKFTRASIAEQGLWAV
jgi:hypothetical protein